MAGFSSLAPKTKNLVVAGGLSGFVLGVYYYTMRAVGGTDELQVAIDKFEDLKKKDAAANYYVKFTESPKMAGFSSLAPKTKNLVVAGGLSGFVLGVTYYTMRAVGGTDELQVAIDKFEDLKKKDAAANSPTAGS